ncbi:MAG TPA: phosphotransferase [Pilimelia sp.]|nr:phosphotransferase [Pilimelia sp.]
MAYSDRIGAALRTGWHRTAQELTPIAAGRSCRGWAVVAGDARFVARLFAATERPRVEAGLAAAERLRARGLAVGRPVRAADGGLTVAVDSGILALSAHVPGRPLAAADPIDQQWWGDLLGTAHRELDGFQHVGLPRWHGIRADAPHLEIEPWLRPAVADAVAALTKLTVTDQLTYGVLHGDPAAAAFRVDIATGRTGMLGWGPAATGPLVYDLAGAVTYAGDQARAAELLDGYAAAGPVTRDEIEATLPVLLRFRWAAEADWYARRLHTQDEVGGPDPADDRAALHAARDALAAITAAESA